MTTGNQPDNFADDDLTWICPPDQGVGYIQGLDLQTGVTLDIYNYRCYEAETKTSEMPEREHPLEYIFYLAKHSRNRGKYNLLGSGIAPREISIPVSIPEPVCQVNVHLEPEVFQTFITNPANGLGENLQHLIRPCDRLQYQRLGITTPNMQRVIQQIMNYFQLISLIIFSC